MKIGGSHNSISQARLSKTTSAIAKALERLSSGSRVNRPADDIAAYSISVGLDSQIRGLSVELRSINDNRGALVAADSALASQIEIVQRMRDIAIQAAASTLSSSDRSNLQDELQKLVSQYQRIADTTTYNGAKLLDGKFKAGADFDFELKSSNANDSFQKTVGTGSFAGRKTFNAAGASGGVQSADFNGDGKLDLFIGSNGSYSFFEGNGDGNFQAAKTFSITDGLADPVFADFNGDGKIDLATAIFGSSPTAMGVAIGNGDGSFQAVKTQGLSFDPYSIRSGDINGDGSKDIIIGGINAAEVYLNDGAGNFGAGTVFYNGLEWYPWSFDLLDVNGDGKDDLINLQSDLGAPELNYHLSNGLGSFGTENLIASFPSGSNAWLFLRDTDGDGRKDILINDDNTNSLRLMRNLGTGVFSAVTLSGVSLVADVQSGDVNGDGTLDLLTADFSNQVSILLGRGGGNFVLSGTIAGVVASQLAVGDFNRDGALDFVNTQSGVDFGLYKGNSKSVSAVSDISVTSESKAQNLLAILDKTLSALESRGSEVSALHSRLNFSESSKLLLRDVYQDAKSRLVDADLALETSEVVRLQILQQSQIAVSAQSNLNAQLVLRLIL